MQPALRSTVAACGALVLATAALAPTSRDACFQDAFVARYPDATPSKATSLENAGCLLCHGELDGTGAADPLLVNAYGWDLVGAVGTKDDRLLLVENRDSDGDGALNRCEIRNGTQPGWTPDGFDPVFDLFTGGSFETLPPATLLGLSLPTEATFALRDGQGTVRCLESATDPIIGADWRIAVDTSPIDEASNVFLLAHARPLSQGLLYRGSELLVDLTSTRLFGGFLPADASGTTTILVPIVPDLQVIGVQGTAQAAVTGPEGAFKLTNAIDVVVGFPDCSHGGGGTGG